MSIKEVSNIKDLLNLALEEKNEDIIEECNLKLDEVNNELKKNETNCFLSG